MMLYVRNLRRNLGAFAIRDVAFDVEDGAYFVLLGASGVGKTLLVELLTGVVLPDAGRILWNGEDITWEKIQKRRMGVVYQDQALFPHLTVRQNIAYGLRAQKHDRAAVYERTRTLAEEFGVQDLLHRYPGTLSGGEAQRVALARALAVEPRCMVLDEPLSSLDIHARGQMRALLRRLHREGRTVIHVTHDYEEAIALATHVGIMEEGTITQSGTPADVFLHPKSEFVARFVGIKNVFKGILQRRETNGDMARFISQGPAFAVLSAAGTGPGSLILRSEDITVSRTRVETSAQNCFQGRVIDVVPARLGIEVTADIGVEITALVTPDSVKRLGLSHGQEVWVEFKASAARFIED
jgi:molybdopterin-binding protein